MLFKEKKRNATPIIPLTANGAKGLLTVALVDGLFTKQKINLTSNALDAVTLEIKGFNALNQVIVGIPGAINNRFDCSGYLVSDSAAIQADIQDRPGITPDEVTRAVYQEEPATALRVVAVDKFGNETRSGMVNTEYDSTSVAYPDAVTEVYSFYKGGLSGVLVATSTIIYTTSSKEFIDSVEVVYP